MEMMIDSAKLTETIECCQILLGENRITEQGLDSLIGRLVHCTKCYPPERQFMNHLLAMKREVFGQENFEWCKDGRKDVLWFVMFLQHYNGVNIMREILVYTECLLTDACLVGVELFGLVKGVPS